MTPDPSIERTSNGRLRLEHAHIAARIVGWVSMNRSTMRPDIARLARIVHEPLPQDDIPCYMSTIGYCDTLLSHKSTLKV